MRGKSFLKTLTVGVAAGTVGLLCGNPVGIAAQSPAVTAAATGINQGITVNAGDPSNDIHEVKHAHGVHEFEDDEGEGEVGKHTASADFVIFLQGVTKTNFTKDITVHWQTQGLKGGNKSGNVTFKHGQNTPHSKLVKVTVSEENYEFNGKPQGYSESFSFKISNATNAVIGDSTASINIVRGN